MRSRRVPLIAACDHGRWTSYSRGPATPCGADENGFCASTTKQAPSAHTPCHGNALVPQRSSRDRNGGAGRLRRTDDALGRRRRLRRGRTWYIRFRRAEPFGVEVHVKLDRTTVRRGETIVGQAIVTNATGRRLTIADCHGSWLQVGLANARVPFEPAWPECLTEPETVLHTGTTRLPLIVRTDYSACTQDAAGVTPTVPKCLPHTNTGMPLLPPGRYLTRVVTLLDGGRPVRTPQPEVRVI